MNCAVMGIQDRERTVRPTARQDEIVRFVHKAGQATVEELADSLQVSRETIRRDLMHLDAMGRLRKYHGGARVPNASGTEPSSEGPFMLRLADSQAAKRNIAQAAARLLSPGDSLFIDTGTTTLVLAEALAELPALVVITNSWRIASTVAGNAAHKVFLIGGAYGADAGESLGPLAVEQIRRFRAQHAFLTIGAANESAVMDFDAQEAEIAKAMIERSDAVTVLADSEKFERSGILEVAPWTRIGRLVTERRPPARIERAMAEAGTECIISDGAHAEEEVGAVRTAARSAPR